MPQENGNSTMEMGTSDQVLVATKRKKKITLIIGFIGMLIAIGIILALVIALPGKNSTSAQPIVSDSTHGASSPSIHFPDTSSRPSLDELIQLEDIINGMYSSPSFNGTWVSGSEVLYRNANGDLVLHDVTTATTTTLISNTSQLLQLSSRYIQLSPDGNYVVLAYNVAPVYRHSYLARYAAIDISSGNVSDILPPGLRSAEAFLQNFMWGPSGTSMVYVYLNNIFYQSSLTAEPQQITKSGQLNVIYHGIPDWVYEEEVFSSNTAMWFSEDETKLAYATFDDSEVKVMRVPHYGVPGLVDYQYTQHHEIRYPKPGTTNPSVTVTLIDLQSNTSTVYVGPDDLDQPILKAVQFTSNNTIAVMWTNRVQTILKVQLCPHRSPNCSTIYHYYEENGWIDNIPFLFNGAGNSFITILPQKVENAAFKQIVQVTETAVGDWAAKDRTKTKHTVLDIVHWSTDDVIWYKATSVSDSAEQHVYTVSNTSKVSCFTCGIKRDDGKECLYNDVGVSAGGDLVTVTCGGPGVPQIFIYNLNGTMIKTWDDNIETSSFVSTKIIPETIRKTVPISNGTFADVSIQVPDGYDTKKNIPLLVYVYGGPDTALVTKQWNVDWGTSLVSRWGIAVAQIDGRGSGLRGVENMFAINRRLGTDEIHDQINVTKWLQESLGWVDANRTCIWGWSYGGYAASLALAKGGDVFRCAIAVAPVVDWRFYDTIYTERYMDIPQNNSLGYLHSSLLTDEVVAAYKKKRYFLVHGTADDNVHYQHAMLISRLLQKKDVYFNQMSYTDEDHGLIGVRPHLYHSLEKFLEENML